MDPVIVKPPKPLTFKGNLYKRWRKWKKSFFLFMEESQMENENNKAKTKLLLCYIGDAARHVYEKFDLTKKERWDYYLVIRRFDEYFSEMENVAYLRYRFMTARQTKDETFSEFCIRLQRLSDDCEFSAQQDLLIRDLIIVGVRDSKLRQQFLKYNNIDLKTIIQLGRVHDVNGLREKSYMKENSAVATKAAESDIDLCSLVEKMNKFRPAVDDVKMWHECVGEFDLLDVIKECGRCWTKKHSKNSCPPRDGDTIFDEPDKKVGTKRKRKSITKAEVKGLLPSAKALKGLIIPCRKVRKVSGYDNMAKDNPIEIREILGEIHERRELRAKREKARKIHDEKRQSNEKREINEKRELIYERLRSSVIIEDTVRLINCTKDAYTATANNIDFFIRHPGEEKPPGEDDEFTTVTNSDISFETAIEVNTRRRLSYTDLVVDLEDELKEKDSIDDVDEKKVIDQEDACAIDDVTVGCCSTDCLRKGCPFDKLETKEIRIASPDNCDEGLIETCKKIELSKGTHPDKLVLHNEGEKMIVADDVVFESDAEMRSREWLNNNKMFSPKGTPEKSYAPKGQDDNDKDLGIDIPDMSILEGQSMNETSFFKVYTTF